MENEKCLQVNYIRYQVVVSCFSINKDWWIHSNFMLDIIQLTAEYSFVLVKFQNIEWNWSGIVLNIYINWTGYLCIYMFSVYSVQSEKKGLMRNDFRNSFVFRLTFNSRMIISILMNWMEILYSGHLLKTWPGINIYIFDFSANLRSKISWHVSYRMPHSICVSALFHSQTVL